jgi:hypothetical protein
MQFAFYPDHEYHCPRISHCPHLGDASLGTVVGLANQNLQQREATFRTIQAQRRTEKGTGPLCLTIEGKDRLLHSLASSKCELNIKEVLKRRPDEETAWPGNESDKEWRRLCFGSKPISVKRPDARNLKR